MPHRTIAALALAAGLAAPATAGELTLGLGFDDALDAADSGAVALGVDVFADPILAYGPISLVLGAGAEADADLDLWAGAGPAIRLDHHGWRLEGSVMPGVYVDGEEGSDLGFPLEFRSRASLSYAVTPVWRAGAAFEHKSNAGLGDDNPGVETVFATITRRF